MSSSRRPHPCPSTPPTIATGPVVGIDVARDELEVAVLDPAAVPARRPQPRATFRCATTAAGLGALIDQLIPFAPALVVLEASGGYERGPLAALWAADLPVAVVNPRRVRWFARSTGQEAKTDAHDALVLAQFGCLTRPTPQPAPTPSLGQLRALVRRREQLVAVRATERQRARQWQRDDAAIYQGCLQLIATLTATIAALDTRIAALVATDATLGHRLRLLQQVPGVGPVVATTLLASLPELGVATDKELAALAGLAPYSRESGQWTGERHIRGGRPAVRRVLYLAAVSARRCNPVIRACFERLRARGKSVKAALIACARKLLGILHALVRDGAPWVDRSVPT